ncbi:MAG: polysaccharide biosynthesis/export family protein [Gemmataceae bacterium]
MIRKLLAAAILAFTFGTSGAGCAAMTNPVADGIPVRLVPHELLAPSKAGEQPLPFNLLGQAQPDQYRLESGDVLGVYIEGYLGEKTFTMPSHVAPLVQPREQRRSMASSGYPVPVQDDGSVDLPAVGSVVVRGLTLAQARDAVRDAYVKKGLLKPELARLIVNLLEKRQYSVVVFRQESASFTGTPETVLATSKRGTGFEVDLPAYQNDILHALARTGGLPGLDAYDEVYVYRNCFSDAEGRAALKDQLGPGKPAPAGPGSCVTRIPLRLPAGAAPCVRPEEVVLHTGDVVYLAARDQEVFFTGGLLPAGIHSVPRDRDLDVIEAVSLVRGPLVNGAFAVSNLSGTLIQPGVGNPSPAQVTVLRRAPNGSQVAITVDLRSALRNPSERLLVRGGDMLILQEMPGQAVARYMSQTLLKLNVYWQVFTGQNGVGIVDAGGPDRFTNTPAVVNLNR